MPISASTSSVCWPAWGGGRSIDESDRLKRGAGRGWTTPAISVKVPAGHVVRMIGGLGQRQDRSEADVGSFEDVAPLVSRFRGDKGRQLLLERGPRAPAHLVVPFLAIQLESLAQLHVELRLYRTERDEPSVAGLVDVVEVRTGVEHVGSALVVPDAHGPEAMEEGHQRGRSVDHGGVDHLALPRSPSLDDATHQPEGEQHAASPEIADQVEGRHRRLSPTTHRLERAGQRDVVDVMAGALGVRTVLAPPRHAPVHEPRISSQTLVGADPQPLGHPRSESLQQRIGSVDQLQHGLDPGIGLEVDPDRAPSPIHHVGGRCGGVAAPNRRRPVDTDDIGSHVGEHHGAERAGPDPRDLDDLYTNEWTHELNSPTERRGRGYRAAPQRRGRGYRAAPQRRGRGYRAVPPRRVGSPLDSRSSGW